VVSEILRWISILLMALFLGALTVENVGAFFKWGLEGSGIEVFAPN